MSPTNFSYQRRLKVQWQGPCSSLELTIPTFSLDDVIAKRKRVKRSPPIQLPVLSRKSHKIMMMMMMMMMIMMMMILLLITAVTHNTHTYNDGGG